MLSDYQTPDEKKIAAATHVIQQKLKQWECYTTLEKILARENLSKKIISTCQTPHPIYSYIEQDLSLALGLLETTTKLLQQGENNAFVQRISSLYSLFISANELNLHSAEIGDFTVSDRDRLQQYRERSLSPILKSNNLVKTLDLGRQNTALPYADLDKIIAGYIDFLRKEETRVNTLSLHTHLYFSKLAEDISLSVEHDRKITPQLDSMIVTLENQKLKVQHRVYTGFTVLDLHEHQAQEHQKLKEYQRRKNMQQDVLVVGNEDALCEINGLINMVALYDPRAQRNIICREITKPLSVLVTGKPGAGKSTMIKYARRRLQQIAQQKGIDYQEIILDNSFQDEYHGKDVKNLKDKISQVEDFTKLGLFVLDDLDGIIQARNARDSTHIEGKSLHTVMQWLDGVDTFYEGNYFIIGTTNYPDKVDPALKRRFTEQIFFEGIKTTEHYVTLLKHELRSNKTYLPLTSADLYALGDMLRKKGCSGADVYQFSLAVNKRINNAQAIDEKIYLKPYDEQQRLLAECKKILPLTELKNIAQQYQPRNMM